LWPTDGHVSQTYWAGHRALDIANQPGAPVYAAGDGIVLLSSEDEDRHGIHLLIDHGDGHTTFYSHLSVVHVKVGEEVKAGQKIGGVGSTGLSTGPHLHFEIRKSGEPVNPLPLMVGQDMQ
jgi:murein DD-endopeptidase MepM/ murein hydrolase activator NlpD